jgi:hypothetical protein
MSPERSPVAIAAAAPPVLHRAWAQPERPKTVHQRDTAIFRMSPQDAYCSFINLSAYCQRCIVASVKRQVQRLATRDSSCSCGEDRDTKPAGPLIPAPRQRRRTP